MRRIAAILTAALLLLLGATPATAAPAPLGGGSILHNGSFRCTAAFAARSITSGFLIAGPGCAATTGTQLYSGGVLVGPVTGVMANGGVVVKVTNTAAWQLVPWIPVGDVRHTIRGSATTPVGGPVCLLDRTAGFRCGTITAINVTVTYPTGTVTGLTRTNICMSTGAIAFVTGAQAQGIPFGGGSCSSSGVSYFVPVNRVLSTYGLTLATG